MATEAERLATLEAQAKAHEKSDDERYFRIEQNSTRTMEMITELGRKLDNGFGRVHERIDKETDDRSKGLTAANDRISLLKIGFLAGAGLGLLGIVVFFVAPYFSKPAHGALVQSIGER